MSGVQPPNDDLRAIEVDMGLRLYEWFMSDAEREVREDFPLLGPIVDCMTQATLKVLRSAPLEERLRIIRANVRVGEKHLAGIGDTTIEDEQIYRQYRPGLTRIEDQEQIYEARGGSPVKIRRAVAQVAEALGRLHGGRMKRSPDCYDLVAPVGDWGLEIQLEFDRRGFTLSESLQHQRRAPGTGDPAVLRGLTLTYPAALGVSSGSWEIYFQEDVEPTVRSVSAVCAHVLTAVRALVGIPEDGMQHEATEVASLMKSSATSNDASGPHDSYHLFQKSQEDAARMLQQAGLRGFALRSDGLWSSFVAEGEPDKHVTLLELNNGFLLHYWHEDEGFSWGFDLYDGRRLLSRYRCDWDGQQAAVERSERLVGPLLDLQKRMVSASAGKDRVALEIVGRTFGLIVQRQLQANPEQIDEDPSANLLNFLGLAHAGELSFEEMLEDYLQRPESFNDSYEGAIAVGIGKQAETA